MTSEIKPCPFCGHVGLDYHEGSTFRWIIAECVNCGATCGETMMQTMGNGTPEEWLEEAKKWAIIYWNTRVFTDSNPPPNNNNKAT